MSEIEKVVEKFSGFLTREQAAQLLKEGIYYETKPVPAAKGNLEMNVVELLEHLKEEEANPLQNEIVVNVKDQIYRIFNPQPINADGKERARRMIVLGSEGCTIGLSISGKLSDSIDSNAFERADTILVRNAIAKTHSTMLKSINSTTISKLYSQNANRITDYSLLQNEMRKVDIVGRLIEIGPVKYVERAGKSRQNTLVSCTISDSANTMDALFLGSSANAISLLKPNEILKIEFCDIRIRDGKVQVVANDDSRIISNATFADRFKK